MLAPGLADAVLAEHFVLGVFPAPFSRFRWPTNEAFVLTTDVAFAAPGLANLWWCRNVGSGLANAVLAQHFVLGMFSDLSTHLGSLRKKLLFLGRALLLRLWVLGTHVRKQLGRLGEW